MDLAGALALFFVTAVVVVGAAIALAVAGDVIASRSGWGRLWVGMLLLAGATSLPELVANVTAVRIGAPSLAAGNIFGANMLNMSNLALLVVLLGGRHFFQRVAPQQIQVAAFAIVLTGIATLFVILQQDTKWLALSPGSLVILGAYAVGSRALYRSTAGIQDVEIVTTVRSHLWGWVVFILAAAAIFASAPFLAVSVRDIAEVTGIAESFLGVLAVAFVTTLPELTTTATALRIGARDLALANMYGTNAFNIAILGVADLFYSRGAFFATLDASHVTAGGFALLLMGLGAVPLLARRSMGRFPTLQVGTPLMVGLYLLGLFLVFRAG